MCEFRRFDVPLKAILALAGLEGARKGLRVQLYTVSTDLSCPSNCRCNRIDEQAHANASFLQIADYRPQFLHSGIGRPSGLARHLARPYRNERTLGRTDPQHEIEEVWPRIAFDVVFDVRGALQQIGDRRHVRGPDVAP